jgi:hypothetical protein
MSTLLTAPIYFNLKETTKGTVLVNNGSWVREEMSTRYDNVRQHYFMDEDGKLKCITGGSANYIIDQHNLTTGQKVKITYDGTAEIQNGKFAGIQAHQFLFEALDDNTTSDVKEEAVGEVKAEINKDQNLEDLA